MTNFCVGDKVTFTNDNGCVFHGKTITKITHFPEDGIFPGQTRYYYSPSDSPWFSVKGENLTLLEACQPVISAEGGEGAK